MRAAASTAHRHGTPLRNTECAHDIHMHMPYTHAMQYRPKARLTPQLRLRPRALTGGVSCPGGCSDGPAADQLAVTSFLIDTRCDMRAREQG